MNWKIREEQKHVISLSLPLQNEVNWDPCVCVLLPEKSIAKMKWSEAAHTTYSIFRGLLFQKDWSLFYVFATSPSQQAIGRIAMN